MLHALLFLGCIISIEIFLNLNFLNHLKKIISLTKKVLLVMSNKEISDHWKERVIPTYALQLMKYSLTILLILLMIIAVFLGISLLESNFIVYILSFAGILESIVFVFLYLKIRSFLFKWIITLGCNKNCIN